MIPGKIYTISHTRFPSHYQIGNWGISSLTPFSSLLLTQDWRGPSLVRQPMRRDLEVTSISARSMLTFASMPQIISFLTFNDQAEEAAKFYTSIFPNSRITSITRYPKGAPAPEGSVMTVSFELDGREFVALNGGPQFSFSQGFSISVQCETQEEIDTYWNKLTEGGQEIACGWLTDKFGLSWQVNPKLLMEMLSDHDPIKVQKAMAAMMTMIKIDVAGLKRAWDES